MGDNSASSGSDATGSSSGSAALGTTGDALESSDSDVANAESIDPSAVCVLLPTLNESETIGSVVEGFRQEGFESILVVDGHSTDGTREIATEAGARVIAQSGSGKGQAVREGVAAIDEPYVLMADGDGTYRPADANRMLEPLFEGRAEHVIGNRFSNMESGAMTILNQFGNTLINATFAAVHGRALEDVLSGYRAFTRETFERFHLTAEGFGIETEMAVECVRHGVDTAVVPIHYESRPTGSQTNLHPVKDGGRIMLTMYNLARTNNPIFYFGSLAMVGLVAGFALGGYVGYRYFFVGTSHEVLALLAAFLVLLSVQLVMFGFLSDVVVSVSREQRRQLEELSDRIGELED